MSVVCCCIALVVFTDPALSENWPKFRGPTGQGISSEKDIPVEWSADANIRWKVKMPGEGHSSPIVWGDCVYVTTATEGGTSFHLVCVDRKTGSLRWDTEILKQEAGHKHALNSYATSTPTTDGESIYVLSADAGIAGVSAEGKVLWVNRDFSYYSEHGLGTSPILYKELVIVPFDYSSKEDRDTGWQRPWDKAEIWAVDKHTGELKWKASRGSSRIAHVTPNILSDDGQDQLVSAAGDVIQGFDLQTGRNIWTFRTFGEGVVPSVVLGEGVIYQVSGFPKRILHAVRTGGEGDITGSHLLWQIDKDVTTIPSILLVEPYLYMVTDGGILTCLKAETGEAVYRKRLDGKFYASPVWADGRIYFLAEKGMMTVIEEGPEFKVVATNEIGDRFIASPAISQGNIFVRGGNTLYCIGK